MKSLIESLRSEKEAMRKDWPQMLMPIGVILVVIWMLLFRSSDTQASGSVTFNPNIQFNAHWTIPITKTGANSDLNIKVGYLYLKCMETLVSKPKCVRIVALVDHESGGSWSPTIKGDGGCSIGIAQWNKCVKRIAATTFEGQVDQIIAEMSAKFKKHSLDVSACLHNSPAGRCGNYVSKVIKSERNFL